MLDILLECIPIIYEELSMIQTVGYLTVDTVFTALRSMRNIAPYLRIIIIDTSTIFDIHDG